MSDPFPAEIWVQILHRVPPKFLVKCTSVCKAWKSLITDYAFMCDHLTHTIQGSNRNASLFLDFALRKGEFLLECEEFYWLYPGIEEIDQASLLRFPLSDQTSSYEFPIVVGTCNGLVFYADLWVGDHIIWNPSIRKYVVLPDPSIDLMFGPTSEGMYGVAYGFGFDSRNKDFKLVRIVARKEKKRTPRVEVYSLASHSWKRITATASPFLAKHVWEIDRAPHMFMNGVLHWVLNRISNGQNYYFILKFDVSEETFGELMLPSCLKESPFNVSILPGEDSLAVLHTNLRVWGNRFFSIWVMKEYGAVESWTQLFYCDSTQYGYRGISSVLTLRSSGEVVLETSRDGIVILDPMKESVKKLGYKGYFKTFVGYYVQSLFLLNKEPSVLSC